MHALLGEFERHHERMIVRARERRAAVQLTNLVDAGRVKTSVSEDDLLGKRLPRDEFQGDTNFRTLKALLKKVDERGFERVRAARRPAPAARHPVPSHLAARVAVGAPARVSRKLLQGLGARHVQGRLGRAEARHHAEARLGELPRRGADQASQPSVLVFVRPGPAPHPPSNTKSLTARSTPRRFGKTFSIAIFCACFLLTQKAEIVVFRQTQHPPRAQGATPRVSLLD